MLGHRELTSKQTATSKDNAPLSVSKCVFEKMGPYGLGPLVELQRTICYKHNERQLKWFKAQSLTFLIPVVAFCLFRNWLHPWPGGGGGGMKPSLLSS